MSRGRDGPPPGVALRADARPARRSRVYRGGMSDLPFGFGPPDRDPERRDQPGSGAGGDPFGFGALFGGAGGGTPEELLGKMPLFAELQKLMTWSGGPVNWDLARQGAVSQLAVGHQPTSQAEQTAVDGSPRFVSTAEAVVGDA